MADSGITGNLRLRYNEQKDNVLGTIAKNNEHGDLEWDSRGETIKVQKSITFSLVP